MTDTEQRRLDAIARATIIGAPLTIHEGFGCVRWPWHAHPIPMLYERDRAYAVAVAEATGLTSYLPFRERVKLWLKSLPGRLLAKVLA